jgi:hypothetical protein
VDGTDQPGTVRRVPARFALEVVIVTVDDEFPAVLPRLPLAPVAAAQLWFLQLSGRQVWVEPDDHDYQRALDAARAAGFASAFTDPLLGLVFDVDELWRLSALPAHVACDADDDLLALVSLALAPDPSDAPASLYLDQQDRLRLRWFDGSEDRDETLTARSLVALSASNLPFVATDEAWDLLRSASVTAGRAPTVTARRSRLGYVELVTATPQLLEQDLAQFPALFRVGDTRFGVPLAAELPATVSWSGPAVTIDTIARPELDDRFDPAQADDIARLAAELTSWRTRLVTDEVGADAPVTVLAALAALDSLPALLVTTPEQVWRWQAAADLLGVTVALDTDADAELVVVTWDDLGAGRWVPPVGAYVFDRVELAAAHQRAVRTLDGVVDAVRVGVCHRLPETLDDRVAMMSALAPFEFSTEVPAQLRYPHDPTRRLDAHLGCYTMPLTATQLLATRLVEVPGDPELLAQLRTLETHTPDPQAVREARLRALSCGVGTRLPTRVAEASRLAFEARLRGETVAVCSQYPELVGPLRAALASLGRGGGVEVCAAGGPLPEADTVILLECPPDWRRAFAWLRSRFDTEGRLAPATLVVLMLDCEVEHRRFLAASSATLAPLPGAAGAM